MFNKFEYVYAVFMHKSFTKAAKALYISQPSLSAAIKKIEDKIGMPIFERQGHEISLTQVGHEYIKAAEQMILAKKEFSKKLNDLYSLETGSIHIGGTNYLCSFIIPKIIRQFKAKHPKIDIILEEANSMTLLNYLENGKIDMLIDSFDAPDENNLFIPLLKEKIFLCVPSDWEINNQLKEYQIPFVNNKPNFLMDTPPVPLNKFEKSNFVLLKKGHVMHKYAMQFFHDARIDPPVSFFVDQLNISYSLAESSMGACFVTDTIVNCSSIPKNLTFYKISGKYNTRVLYLSYKSERYSTKAMNEFIHIAKETIV